MRYEPPKASEQEIEGAAPQGSIEAIDPFSTPIPGQSLTMEPGSQKFERPWEFTDPDDCVAFIIERMETDRAVKEEQPETMIRSMSKLNPEGYESLREGVSRANLEQEIGSGGFLGPVGETLPEAEEEPIQLPDEGGMI